MSRFHVYGVGNALVDMEYEIPESVLEELSIDKGLMTLIEEDRHHELRDQLAKHPHKRACGGSAANTMIAVSQLGGNAYYSCKVGNDEAGTFYLQDMKDCGVESTALEHEREEGITGKCLVMITPDADRTMNTFLGITNFLSTAEINEEAISRSDYVYLEGYLVASGTGRKAAVEASRIAREAKIPTSLTLSDPNMVNFFREGLLEMAGPDLDLLFCNEAEALDLSQSGSMNEAVESLKSIARKFAITRGPQGALLFDGENLIEIDSHKVEAVDTNGAGDLYAGSFLYGITHGMSFTQAGDLASLMSSRLVTQFGPRLSHDQAQELLKRFTSEI